MTAVVPPDTSQRTSRFQQMLRRPYTDVLMEAHNGLSARIVEEAGFKGIWGSGLSISAALGVRDNNEASWTQVMEVVEFMSDATTIPILLDADTGYGNFNNVRTAGPQARAAGRGRSMHRGQAVPQDQLDSSRERQPLEDIDEFAGKIKAAKEAQQDADFCCRRPDRGLHRRMGTGGGAATGRGLSRGRCRRHPGAQQEVRPPTRCWLSWRAGGHLPGRHRPDQVPSDPSLRIPDGRGQPGGLGQSTAALQRSHAMQQVARQLHDTRSMRNVETSLVPVSEVFRLQQVEELLEAEQQYLPRTS